MSSWVFGLKPGDKVTVAGPFGEFFARDTDKEMFFIGGGARHGADALAHLRPVQAAAHPAQGHVLVWRTQSARGLLRRGFRDAARGTRISVASGAVRAAAEDNWTGFVGFIHNVLHDQYLKNHPAPEDIEYYMCGPGPMNKAVIAMLLSLGVDRENIMLDDFG